VAVVVATTLVWAPNASAGDGVRTYTTCVAFEQRPDQDASCVQSDAWGGVLIAKREDLKYRVCIRGLVVIVASESRRGRVSRPLWPSTGTGLALSVEVEDAWPGAR
jgi:hypothetical protein